MSALRFAYRNRARWIDMGKKAREIVIKNHSWQSRVRDRLIPEVERVLKN
jgi:hypothetical protein